MNTPASMSRPSFFEVSAAERLTEGLRPALQHILATLSNHVPPLAMLAQRGDEVFYLMCFLLDRHYLKTHNASFAENFYCLKRVKILPDDTKAPLDDRDRLGAVVCLSGVPYLRSKLEAYYTETNLNFQAFPHDDGSWMTFFRKSFVSLYPYAALMYEGLEYLHAIQYVMGTTQHFSPLTLLLNQRVERLTIADMLRKHKGEGKARAITPKPLPGRGVRSPMESAWQQGTVTRVSIAARVFALISRMGSFVADNAKWAVYLGVFLIRFLQWWYSPENQQRNEAPLATPPPPPPAVKHPRGVAIPEDKSKCPLCLRSRVNAALLPSGFVFCYTCVFNHLKDHGTCPVTLRPCRIEELRKIYES
mmetsp:Transcript_20549/g.39638  ORF Transcript_20549/g.39638 Transcript_20549/m.39638 type:complete len:362 (-) Transcript_20549:232-1317(-)